MDRNVERMTTTKQTNEKINFGLEHMASLASPFCYIFFFRSHPMISIDELMVVAIDFVSAL